MATDKTLPPVGVPEAFYELIRLYAFQNKLSLSAALRQLLKESPGLVALANKENVDISSFTVGSWGGDRRADHMERLEKEREVLRKLAEYVADRSLSDDRQLEALGELLNASPSHHAYLGQLLRRALRAHYDGYGKVQRAIVEGIGAVGDTTAISTLELMRTKTNDPDVLEAVNRVLDRLKREKSLKDELLESRRQRRQSSN